MSSVIAGHHRLARRVTAAAGATSILVGLLVLIGWSADIALLKSIAPGLVAMKANTALAFLLSGYSLWIAADRPAGGRSRACGLAAALVVAVVSLLTLSQYALSVDLGIDQLLVRDVPASAANPFPGRMAHVTALDFLLVGSALLLLHSRHAPLLCQTLATMVLLVSALCSLSHLFGAATLQSVRGFSTVAVHTSVTFLFLSVGLVFATSPAGMMGSIVSDGVDGVLVRRLLPVAVVVPVTITIGRLYGQWVGWYGTEFGAALAALGSMVMCVALVFGTARIVQRFDAERTLAERAVKESEARLRVIVEASPSGLVMVGRDRRIALANGTLEQQLGYTKDELRGMLVDQLIPALLQAPHPGPPAPPGAEPHMAPMGSRRDLTALRKDGRELPVDVGLTPVRMADGEFVLCSVVDTTYRREAEESLKSSERRYRQLADSMPQIVWTARPDGYVDYYNDRWYEYTGCPRGRGGDESWMAALHPDDLKRCLDRWYESVRSGRPYQIEYRFRSAASGEHRWHLGRALPVRDPDGTIVRWIGTSTDIDDQKRLAAKLESSERRFRLLLEGVPQLVWTCAADGPCDYLSPQWTQYTGVPAADHLGYGWTEAVHPEDRAVALERWERALKTSEPFDVEFRIRNAAGEYRWFNARAVRYLQDDGSAKWFGTCTDIQERKLAAEHLRRLNVSLEERVVSRSRSLRESEERFRAIFNAQFQFIGLMSTSGILLEANDTALAAVGTSKEAVCGKPFWETVWWTHDPVLQDRLREAVKQAASGVRSRFEGTHRAADGSLIWVDFSLSPYFDEDGKVILLIPEGRDITQRKQAEQALSAKTQVLETILNSMGDAVLVADAEGRILLRNRAFQQLHGTAEPGALEGWPEALGAYLPGGKVLCAGADFPMARAIRGDATDDVELLIVNSHHPGGVPISITGRPLPGLDGPACGVLVIRDLTSRKQAEAALLLSEERFRSAFEHAAVGMALVAPSGAWLRVNRALCDLLGYTEAELLASDFQTLTHPDDLDTELDQIRRALAGSISSYQVEKRYHHKRGDVITALLTVSLVRDGDGRPLYFVKQILDVTQRKKAEAALAAQDALLRQFIKHSPAAIAMFDRSMRYVHASDRWLSDYHLTGRNIIGASHYEVFPGTSDRWRAIHQRVLAGAVEACDEDPFTREDGTTEWLQWECRPWLIPGGDVGGLIIFAQIISARKRAEELVRTSLREKEVLLKEIHHRVKNNLQIVSTLLDLQSEHTSDPATLEMFQESRSRVRSMALIHERLYRSHDIARVDFGEYVRQLAADLYRTYKVSDDDIRLVVSADLPPLTLDIAIPCGLLLNELMSNSLKHAFAGRSEGCLQVTLSRDADGANVLVVADDGVGFPAGIDFRKTSSFGLQLVTTLADQLDGDIALTVEKGTRFTIRFPRTGNSCPIGAVS